MVLYSLEAFSSITSPSVCAKLVEDAARAEEETKKYSHQLL
jgi:hypothetical protein